MLTTVPLPAGTVTTLSAPSPAPVVRTNPSVVVTVVTPDTASTFTWNAVPTTCVELVAVVTTYFPSAVCWCVTTCHVLPAT